MAQSKIQKYYHLFRKIEIFRSAFDAAIINAETKVDIDITKEEVIEILESLHAYGHLNNKLLSIMSNILDTHNVFQYCRDYGITYDQL